MADRFARCAEGARQRPARAGAGAISSALLETMRGFGSDQGVGRGGAQLFQSRAAGHCFAGRKFAGPNPKLLHVARKFAQPRFEEIRKRLKAAAKGQHRQ